MILPRNFLEPGHRACMFSGDARMKRFPERRRDTSGGVLRCRIELSTRQLKLGIVNHSFEEQVVLVHFLKLGQHSWIGIHQCLDSRTKAKPSRNRVPRLNPRKDPGNRPEVIYRANLCARA